MKKIYTQRDNYLRKKEGKEILAVKNISEVKFTMGAQELISSDRRKKTEA